MSESKAHPSALDFKVWEKRPLEHCIEGTMSVAAQVCGARKKGMGKEML